MAERSVANQNGRRDGGGRNKTSAPDTSLDLDQGRNRKSRDTQTFESIADMTLDLDDPPPSQDAVPDMMGVRAAELMKSDRESDRQKADKLFMGAERLREFMEGAATGVGQAATTAGQVVGQAAGQVAEQLPGMGQPAQQPAQPGQAQPAAQAGQPQQAPQGPPAGAQAATTAGTGPNQFRDDIQAATQAVEQAGQDSVAVDPQTGVPQIRGGEDQVAQQRAELAEQAGLTPQKAAEMTVTELQNAATEEQARQRFKNASIPELQRAARMTNAAGRVAQRELEERKQQMAAQQRQAQLQQTRAEQGVGPEKIGEGLGMTPSGEVVGPGPSEPQPETTTFEQGEGVVRGDQVIVQPDTKKATKILDSGEEWRDAEGNLIAKNESDEKQVYMVGENEHAFNEEGDLLFKGPAPKEPSGELSDVEKNRLDYYQNQLESKREELRRLKNLQERVQANDNRSMTQYQKDRLSALKGVDEQKSEIEVLENKIKSVFSQPQKDEEEAPATQPSKQEPAATQPSGQKEPAATQPSRKQGDQDTDKTGWEAADIDPEQLKQQYQWSDEDMTVQLGGMPFNMSKVPPDRQIPVGQGSYTTPLDIMREAKRSGHTPARVLIAQVQRKQGNQSQ